MRTTRSAQLHASWFYSPGNTMWVVPIMKILVLPLPFQLTCILTRFILVGFAVLTALNKMNATASSDVTPCSLTETYQRFSRTSCLLLCSQDGCWLVVQNVDIYQNTRPHIPEYTKLRLLRSKIRRHVAWSICTDVSEKPAAASYTPKADVEWWSKTLIYIRIHGLTSHDTLKLWLLRYEMWRHVAWWICADVSEEPAASCRVYPVHGGNKFIQNVDTFLPCYTVSENNHHLNYKDYCLLECDTEWPGRELPTFRRKLLRPTISSSLTMKTTGSSETPVTLAQTSRRHVPAETNLHINIRENLKCHIKIMIR
jgi:hypothetical protein